MDIHEKHIEKHKKNTETHKNKNSKDMRSVEKHEVCGKTWGKHTGKNESQSLRRRGARPVLCWSGHGGARETTFTSLSLPQPRIELGAPPWEGGILPLNH